MIYEETPVDGTPGWSVREYREGPCTLIVTCDENGPMTYSFRHDNPLGPGAIVDPTPDQPGSLYVCVTFQKVAAEVGKLDRVNQMVDDVRQFFKSLEKSGHFKIERENKKKEDGAMRYDVTVARVGSVSIDAGSPEEAMEKANKLPSSAITWADDFTPTDAQEI